MLAARVAGITRGLLRLPGIIALLMVSVSPMPSHADQTIDPCLNTARTQAAIDECASKVAAIEDAALKKTYSALLKAAASQPGAVSKIESQERAWLVYRKAYLDATFPAQDKQREYGSMYPTRADLIWAWLTRRHVQELQRILASYVGE